MPGRTFFPQPVKIDYLLLQRNPLVSTPFVLNQIRSVGRHMRARTVTNVISIITVITITTTTTTTTTTTSSVAIIFTIIIIIIIARPTSYGGSIVAEQERARK